MIHVPSDLKDVLKLANDLVEQCNVSVAQRSAECRLLNIVFQTGTNSGLKALLNELPKQLADTSAHLFSPVELKFALDFENEYPKMVYDQGSVVARVIRRQWERNNTDLRFGLGVTESLKYGAAVIKQWAQVDSDEEDKDEHATYHSRLLMPWKFGVYNEGETDINEQPALCETFTITLPEVWRRIWHLPNAKKLFERIRQHSMSGTAMSEPQSFFHQVLSTSQISTGSSTTGLPGGIVQIGNDPNYATMGPQIAAPVVTGHELWVKDDSDYTTIILIEPDILLAPLFKKANLLVKDSKLQPYRVIQPNVVAGWFWGRSELVDLIEPQGLLSEWLNDMRRLTGLQIDKILGLIGDNTITDERYGQMREAGFINLGPGSSVTDLTPAFPNELLPAIKFLLEELRMLGGFPPIMRGQGEPGVRAGSHANTLMKTASPTLRDRALVVERQCADVADLTLSIREAKDPQHYWIKGDTPQAAEESRFLLSALPGDWRMVVDSHSSSPIFSDENEQLVFASHKMGIVDGEYVIDNTALPNKEVAKTAYREKQKRQAEQMQVLMKQFPEAGEKIAVKQLTGGRR